MAVDKFMCVNVDVIVVYYKVDRLLNSLYGMWTSMEVKIRGPEQGLGPIKKMRFWNRSQSPKNHVVGPIPQIISVVIPEQHFL